MTLRDSRLNAYIRRLVRAESVDERKGLVMDTVNYVDDCYHAITQEKILVLSKQLSQIATERNRLFRMMLAHGCKRYIRKEIEDGGAGQGSQV